VYLFNGKMLCCPCANYAALECYEEEFGA
jgi:hypothetical protein